MLVRLKITANVFGCLAAVASAFDDMIELPLIGRKLLSHFGMPLSILIYGYDGPPGRPGPHVPNQAGLNQDWR